MKKTPSLFQKNIAGVLLRFFSFFLSIGLMNQLHGATINVSSVSALQTAANSAAAGDIIVLADGTYSNSTLTISTSNITVKSASPGGVFLNGTNAITITGNFVTFSGFQFTSGSIAGIAITVEGSNNVLTQLNFNGYSAQKYINIKAPSQYNEVSYCNFENKPSTAPIGNLVHVGADASVVGYHKIRYCSFKNMPGAGGDAGNECIRLSNGAQSTYIARTVVEYCYFENTGGGDSEALSVKCRENVLRFNTFKNNQNAMMVFRNGNDNIAYGNFFINAGGIRVKEANNIYCYNNYFENAGVGGTMNAVSYIYISPNLNNINFLHNTFVDCGLIDLASGASNNTWANNVFKKTTGDIFLGSSAGISWAGNIYSGTLGISIPSGMSNVDPLLTLNSDGYFGLSSSSPAINAASASYPAITNITNVDDDPTLLFDVSGQARPSLATSKDVGCDEFTTGSTSNHPLALSEVGPSYLGGTGGGGLQNQTITFPAIPTKALGNPDFSPGATASSGLAVSYSSSNPAVATIIGGNIHLVGIGTSVITASQAGNASYNPAPDVTQTLSVVAVYNYAPSSTTILQGSINAGGFGNLANNDASYVVVNSTTSSTRRTDWYGSTTITQAPSSVSKLTITYDGKNSASKTQTLYLYDWASSAWTQIDSRTVSTSDVLITSIQTSPANFISSSGEIRLRVFSSGGTKNYTCSGDWIRFSIESSSALMPAPLSELSSIKVNPFSLKAFPNPGKDRISIAYSLPTAADVLLQVYALNGQMVKTLVRNQTQAAGTYAESFDTSGLSEGAYFARLVAGGQVQTLKLMVTK